MNIPTPKFNIGQTVDVIHAGAEKTRLYILDVQTVTCTAGTQIYYGGRLVYNGQVFDVDYKDSKKPRRNHLFTLKEVKLREDELREVPESVD